MTELILDGLNTSNVTDMDAMFNYCVSLKLLNIDNFDTANVQQMGNMFAGCIRLETLNLSNFDTSKVTNMSNMFENCKALRSLDLSSFNTDNVSEMYAMFKDCQKMNTIDLSSFDTSIVTEMDYMFYGCESLKALDLSKFDTEQVDDMSEIFTGCRAIEILDISGFNNRKDMNFVDLTSLHAIALGETVKDMSKDEDVMWKRYQTLDGEPVDGPFLRTLRYYDGQNPGWYRPVLSSVSIANSSGVVFTGNYITPKVDVYSNGIEELFISSPLKMGRDYTVTYSNNKNVGTAKVTVQGAGKFSGTLTGTFKITPRKLSTTNLTVKKDAVFTGKAIPQKVTVKAGNTVLKKGTDYTVSYLNNKKVGTAKAIVKGKGNYSGSVSKTFRILPPRLKASAAAKKGKVIVTLKSKPKCAVTYYVVRVGTNKAVTKGVKTSTAKLKGKKLNMATSLKKGKKYYVKTRAVTVIKGEKYAGAWSKVMTIKGK